MCTLNVLILLFPWLPSPNFQPSFHTVSTHGCSPWFYTFNLSISAIYEREALYVIIGCLTISMQNWTLLILFSFLIFSFPWPLYLNRCQFLLWCHLHLNSGTVKSLRIKKPPWENTSLCLLLVKLEPILNSGTKNTL